MNIEFSKQELQCVIYALDKFIQQNESKVHPQYKEILQNLCDIMEWERKQCPN